MSKRYFALPAAALGLLLAGAASALAQSNSNQIMALEQAGLVEILENAETPAFEKAKACQRLAVVGTKESVPALVALLPDETLNIYARFGLEAIPDPAAGEALREAASRLDGRPLAGVIDSIGNRRDAEAVGLLKGFLSSSQRAVASAAAGALGRIGTREAGGILQEALAADTPLKTTIADACLDCAEELAAAGDSDEAVRLYEAVVEADLPEHLRVAALQGKFRLLKGDAKGLLLTQIRSEDETFFNLGLAMARELPGEGLAEALAAELENLPPERQALVLLALGDRDEPAPSAAVLAASKSDSPAVREAAIRVLAKVGDATAVEVLLDAALSEEEVARSAQQRLKTLPGEEVDAAIMARLEGADPKHKVVLFDIVGARRIAGAKAAVQDALADADGAVKAAAIAALGQLIELDELDLLIRPALAGEDPVQTEAARAALRTAALRLGDREAAAGKLAASMQGESAPNQVYLLELLGEVSGRKALKTVVAAVQSDYPEVKDAATRVLGEWTNADAAPALLEIAGNDADSKYRIRALRGYIRIARQLQLPEEDRLAMFHTALEVSQRVEEKQLALDILTRIPSQQTLPLAVSYLEQPELKDAAAEAAVKIAGRLIDRQPEAVAEAMQKVVEAGVGGDYGNRAQQLLERAKAGSR